MKKIRLTCMGIICIAVAIISMACTTTTTAAQTADPTGGLQKLHGVWEGTLIAGGTPLLLQFAIAPDDTGSYQAKLTIPQQMAANLPSSSLTMDADAVTMEFNYFGISLNLQADDPQTPRTLTGTYFQAGEYPLVLSKTELDPLTFNRRPQDPVQSYPYISENITFSQTVEQFTLAGTVTRPNDGKKHPAVVLVSGSGSQDRNEELMNHRPFLVLADALTKAGYAVFRYDDRGYGLSGGNPLTATTLEIADDASAALDWLKEQPYVETSKLFVIGHSEGGIIAPILASRRDDLAGIVMLAGTGVPGKQISLYQAKIINMAMGIPEETADLLNSLSSRVFDIATDKSKTEEQRMAEIMEVVQTSPEQVRPLMEASVPGFSQLFIPWQQTFLTLDPAAYLGKVEIPTLVLNGDKDFQVPVGLNIPAIERAFENGARPDYMVIIYENLNHLFQPCETGMLDEYYQIETTIAPQVLSDIVQWLNTICETSL